MTGASVGALKRKSEQRTTHVPVLQHYNGIWLAPLRAPDATPPCGFPAFTGAAVRLGARVDLVHFLRPLAEPAQTHFSLCSGFTASLPPFRIEPALYLLMGAIFHNGEFAGTVLAARTVGDLSLAETKYAPAVHVPTHAHDHAICSLVLEGGFTERASNKHRVLDAGALLFHPADEAHAHDFHRSGGHCFNVQFGAEWMRRLRELDVEWPSTPVDLHRSRGRWIAEQLRAEVRSADPASALIIEGHALALLGEIARSTLCVERRRPGPAWLRRAIDLLHERQSESVGLAEIAHLLDVHPTHLARTFRSHVGCSMGEYVRRLRIEGAARRLASTDDALAVIALDAGFADQAHFSRMFKRATGLSPGTYRRNHR